MAIALCVVCAFAPLHPNIMVELPDFDRGRMTDLPTDIDILGPAGNSLRILATTDQLAELRRALPDCEIVVGPGQQSPEAADAPANENQTSQSDDASG